MGISRDPENIGVSPVPGPSREAPQANRPPCDTSSFPGTDSERVQRKRSPFYTNSSQRISPINQDTESPTAIPQKSPGLLIIWSRSISLRILTGLIGSSSYFNTLVIRVNSLVNNQEVTIVTLGAERTTGDMRRLFLADAAIEGVFTPSRSTRGIVTNNAQF